MSDKKRQVLPTGLWVVATPIGNLQDLTPRAKQALAEASVVLCEDTRRTSALLSSLEIDVRTERLDAHSTPARIQKIVARLGEGESMALVSDAGTPAISDPGAELVKQSHETGVTVTPIPGVSAVTALLSVSGFSETGFVFRGFFPRKASERESEVSLAQASRVARVFVWFESPQRIEECLEVFATRADDAELVVAKELTKLHEKFFVGKPQDILAQVRTELETEGARGEWCLAACFAPLSDEDLKTSHLSAGQSVGWERALQCLQDAGVPASEAARQVSQHFGIARNSAYSRAIGKKS